MYACGREARWMLAIIPVLAVRAGKESQQIMLNYVKNGDQTTIEEK
jgi:hypothetical protein